MEHRTIKIETPLGPVDFEAVLSESADGWTATLLDRPGYSVGGAITAATPEEALAQLTELAQRQYAEQVAREVELYGGRVR